MSPTTSPVDEFNFSQVLGTIENPGQEMAVIAVIVKATSVQFLELHLLRGYDPKALVFAPKQTKFLTELRAAVGWNNALAAKLRRAGFLLSDVVGILADPAGNPFVFVNL